MMYRRITEEDVYRFILAHIDSVPRLEALLLLWRSRPRPLSVEQLSRELFVDESAVRGIVMRSRKTKVFETASTATGPSCPV